MRIVFCCNSNLLFKFLVQGIADRFFVFVFVFVFVFLFFGLFFVFCLFVCLFVFLSFTRTLLETAYWNIEFRLVQIGVVHFCVVFKHCVFLFSSIHDFSSALCSDSFNKERLNSPKYCLFVSPCLSSSATIEWNVLYPGHLQYQLLLLVVVHLLEVVRPVLLK